MRRSILIGLFVAVLLTVALVETPSYSKPPAAAATTVPWPAPITNVGATPGPRVGEVTFHWTSDGTHTTSFRVETALSMFSRTNPTLPRYGRHHTVFKLSPTVRSLTLSAAQVAAAGAAVSTGNHFYYRVFAFNWTSQGYHIRQSALLGVRPKPGPAPTSGTSMRVASFNVRTARATTDARTWLERAPDVAKEIVWKNPVIVALQELNPGRADGADGSTKNYPRQTESLLSTLGRYGGAKYALVRTTSYVAPGTLSGPQGARILYDTVKLQQLTSCPNSSSGGNYSGSCSIKLPILSGDSETIRRRAAYAEFRVKATGKRFWFVSVHLDERQGDNLATSQRYNKLRADQIAAVRAFLGTHVAGNEQVIVAGDFNSWQSNLGGNGPHDYLVSHGYYDASAAVRTVNLQYPTVNHFFTVQKPSAQSYAAQIDMIFVKGITGAGRFQNVLNVVDSSRPSDHNLVFADLVL
jgi:endonuclease/exonuclease/phosphatase family metal-dependent hydrolase